MQTFTIDIRPKRQVTLPKELLAKLDAEVGDSLKLTLGGDKVTLTSQKKIALNAFAELQRVIKESGVSEVDFQKTLRSDRKVDV